MWRPPGPAAGARLASPRGGTACRCSLASPRGVAGDRLGWGCWCFVRLRPVKIQRAPLLRAKGRGFSALRAVAAAFAAVALVPAGTSRVCVAAEPGARSGRGVAASQGRAELRVQIPQPGCCCVFRGSPGPARGWSSSQGSKQPGGVCVCVCAGTRVKQPHLPVFRP